MAVKVTCLSPLTHGPGTDALTVIVGQHSHGGITNEIQIGGQEAIEESRQTL
ncbi:MAG: hypothetical protein M0Z55_03875 [Peptococcaceae bacterium]|nr:hypothetical protein [Peptococcaceae bacterium]